MVIIYLTKSPAIGRLRDIDATKPTGQQFDTPQTLQQAVEFFADPARCDAFMVALRWPNGVGCPTCGSVDVRYLANQRRWECKEKHPRRQFSAKVGTIFEDSPIVLKSWLLAVWMI